MAFSDLYEVVHRQEQDGEPILNVYHVERDNVGVDAQIVAESFNDTIMPELADLQYTGLNNVSIDARSLDDPFDFFSRVPTIPAGLRVGANFAQFNVVTIQFNRNRTDMRNGQKRFTAGVEADSNGAVWLAGLLADAVDLTVVLLNAWELGGVPGVAQCRYVVLKRICKSSPSPPCVAGYRLPIDDIELQLFRPITAIVRNTVRSQTSRKRLT